MVEPDGKEEGQEAWEGVGVEIDDGEDVEVD